MTTVLLEEKIMHDEEYAPINSKIRIFRGYVLPEIQPYVETPVKL